MQTAGRQANNNITLGNRLAGDNFIFFDDADDKTDQVVILLFIDIRHLGCFSADKGAASITAGLSHPLDDSGHFFRHQFADADVIEEEERLSAAGQYIIDAVINNIKSDGIVPVQRVGYLELGADAVDAGYQYRIFVALELKKSAE